jgi:RecJ-like exonuclease
VTDRQKVEIMRCAIKNRETFTPEDIDYLCDLAIAGLNEPPEGAVKVRMAVAICDGSGYVYSKPISGRISEEYAMECVRHDCTKWAQRKIAAEGIVTAYIPPVTIPEARGRVE